ncbi:MAG: 3-hydroxyacyl-CoA dehydrogenase, 3-hydroxybutyryl-CoA dehydrogenase [candidate division NC10 bacterium CSP1-5]|nr:MAG: 3-hydroxyacyl-CoA dehydrogenase, 3-hydroxybutyryl-CoA dehydrogenase [candidate division NC10 bacterium CSP1-5]
MTMKIEEIKTVAVIGAGVMGSGIAQHLAQAGYEVRLHARHDETLAAARARVAKNQELMVETGLLTASAAAQAFSRIRTTTDLEEAARGVQFVNESAPEDLDLKGRIFAALDRSTPPEAILSTNTSGLSITAIAAATTRPERVVGLHWMNPPHLMPPVEVTRGTQTSSAVVDLTCDLARRIGRIPIRVERDVPGLLWNRLQFALVREAVHLVEEGIASPEAVDLAVTAGLGLRWATVGPMRIMDLAGIQTFHAIAAYLYPELSTAKEPQRSLSEKVTRGHTGARAGQGFYTYPPGAHEAAIAGRDAKLFALLKLRAQGWDP